jgi:CSLREA domain-containing protein
MSRLSARLFGFRTATRPGRRAGRNRLLVEHLEDRTVPSPLVVTTTADGVDPDDHVMSLREALQRANDTAGPDEIIFARRAWGTLTLDETLGQLEVTDDLKVLGPGAGRLAVSGNDKVRVFYVGTGDTGAGIEVAISGLTITRGVTKTPDTVLHSHGGGILNDTDADLTLTDVVLSHNKAVGVEDVLPPGEERHLGVGAGGGVANKGNLTVTGCTFVDNRALGADYTDGVFAIRDGLSLSAVKFPGMGIGGGLWNWKSGTATVTDSRFIDNRARGGDNCTGTFAGLGQGGAIYNDNDLTVTGTLFSGNRAVGGSHTVSDVFSGEAVGGAISSGTNERLVGDPASAVLAVSQSAFVRNQAVGGNENLAGPQGVALGAGGGFGGGIFVFQGEATIRGTTLADNRAVGGKGATGRVGGLAIGGGILFVNFLGPVTGTVEGSALLGNEAVGGTGGAGARGGDAQGGGLAAGTFGLSPLPLPGNVEVSNTLVAGNLARGGDGGTNGNGGDGQGGGLYNGAGSAMKVTRSLITLNRARGGEGPGAGSDGEGVGGGVYNLGTFTPTSTLILGNWADEDPNRHD